MEDKEKQEKPVKIKKVKKPVKIKTTEFTLLKDVSIGGKVVQKGKKVRLTEIGRKSFKKLNYI